ncbi:MAG: glycosyltransferase family 2 protein [Azovibrio sp.]|nr:glycosyltransferase family 2 protein [Azovibrio sp.]
MSEASAVSLSLASPEGTMPVGAAMPPLSLVIITCNAASQLAACIASVPFAAEVLVVDSGSSDNTVALARELGARVIFQEWLGYGRQKQYAVEQARHDWVLCLDADERLSPDLADAIRACLAQPAYSAYRFRRCNRFMGRYLRHGEGYPDWSLRLFDRRQARWSFDPVHEQVVLQPGARCGRLAGDLLHDSAESLEAYLAKQNRYTSLAAERAFARGKRAAWPHLLVSPLFRFFRFYVWRQGFRDGLPGFVHIAIGCFNSFCKYAKLRELERAAMARRD